MSSWAIMAQRGRADVAPGLRPAKVHLPLRKATLPKPIEPSSWRPGGVPHVSHYARPRPAEGYYRSAWRSCRVRAGARVRAAPGSGQLGPLACWAWPRLGGGRVGARAGAAGTDPWRGEGLGLRLDLPGGTRRTPLAQSRPPRRRRRWRRRREGRGNAVTRRVGSAGRDRRISTSYRLPL